MQIEIMCVSHNEKDSPITIGIRSKIVVGENDLLSDIVSHKLIHNRPNHQLLPSQVIVNFFLHSVCHRENHFHQLHFNQIRDWHDLNQRHFRNHHLTQRA
jgi:hypothetical protein